ncbi:hypothetical protein FACS189461_1180 [Spirochaetia bacterium]|nr:hypothetical protein FACS189461_1180 [Spirochaetia bacterium]
MYQFNSSWYNKTMSQTVTIEIVDTAAFRLLRDLAAMSLIRFAPEPTSESGMVTARLNAVYAQEGSSLDPGLALAQAEAISGEDW